MSAKIYKIKCLTNLHVGNGDVNFNIIDNEVEKDPVTGYPTINASGVKGALRSHFETVLGKNDEKIIKYFGKANKKGETVCPGAIKIMCANMLAIPMRTASGNKPYVLVTTETAIENYKTLSEALTNNDVILNRLSKLSSPEGNKCDTCVNIYGEDMYIMDSETFDQIPLPVVARNCLDEKKENLWYEEIVPHESVFYFFIMGEDNDVEAFNDIIKKNNIIQFGGNASIGCGVCKVEEG